MLNLLSSLNAENAAGDCDGVAAAALQLRCLYCRNTINIQPQTQILQLRLTEDSHGGLY